MAALSPEQIAQYAYAAGFRGEDLVLAVAIAMAESSGNPESVNNTPSTGDYSVGLWQINYYSSLRAERTRMFGPPEGLTNPAKNAAAAYTLYRNRGGFRDWSTYNRGAHLRYMSAARSAIASLGSRVGDLHGLPAAGPTAKQQADQKVAGAYGTLTGKMPTGEEIDRWSHASLGTVIRPGSSGDNVKNLQAFLKARGYDPGPIDGVYGPRTQAAVVELQRRNGLTPDGIVGPKTMSKIASVSVSKTAPKPTAGTTTKPPTRLPSSTARPSTPAPRAPAALGAFDAPAKKAVSSATSSATGWGSVTLKSGSSGADVKALQSFLARRGYSPGPIDGIFGSQTAAAVRALQSRNGLAADGVVGSKTWGKILSVSSKPPA